MEKKTIKALLLISGIVLGIAVIIYAYTQSQQSMTTIIVTQSPTTEEAVQSETQSDNITTSVKTTKIRETKTTAAKTEKISVKTEAVSEEETEPLWINLNTADFEDFCRLDGIGEHLADEIMWYRDENGGFRNIEEIMNVRGIGEAVFEKIRDFIYVENPYYPEEENEEYHEDEEQQTEEKAPVLEDFVPININSADRELLMLLPYVGEEQADEIIELREKLGGFSNTLELLYLKTLSQKQIAEITDYITAD